ncbi:MAG TPA: GreA/GreB family elongation factor [Flavitalea sp.]|nr:GreA/GreB family elongation factor [Flavitalea sp.]
MKATKNQLVLLKDDYTVLRAYLTGSHGRSAFDRRNAEALDSELKKAKLVNKDVLPLDVVRINSKVKIKAEGENRIMELTLVTPDKANIREKKVSIMAPIGTALIGFRQGQKVKWQVPGGQKTFTIMEVINQ